MITTGVQSLATHGTCTVITSSGTRIMLPPGARLLRGRFPFDRLVRIYPLEEVGTAIADSLAGTTIKPVLTFGPVR